MPYHGEKRNTMNVPKLPHPMYKGKDKKMAKTVADHHRLERMGYTHTKPK